MGHSFFSHDIIGVQLGGWGYLLAPVVCGCVCERNRQTDGQSGCFLHTGAMLCV